MSKIQQLSVSIGIGQGCSLGITTDNELVLNYTPNGVVQKQISMGVRDQQDIDSLCDYLQRLKIHL